MKNSLISILLFLSGSATAQNLDSALTVFLNESLPDSQRTFQFTTLLNRYVGKKTDSLLWLANYTSNEAQKPGKQPNWSGLNYYAVARYHSLKSRPDSCKIVAEQGIAYLANQHSPTLKARLLTLCGVSDVISANFESAITYFKRAQELLNPEVDLALLGHLYALEGGTEAERGNNLSALYALNKAIRFAEKSQDIEVQASAKVSIGVIFTQLGMEDEARIIIGEGAELYQKFGKNFSIINSYAALIPIAAKEAEARDFFYKGIAYSQKQDLVFMQNYLHYALGKYYKKINQRDSSILHFSRAYVLATQYDDPRQARLSNTEIGILMVEQGKTTVGIAKLESELRFLQAQSTKDLLLSAYIALSKGYKATSNWTQAYFYLEKGVLLQDSINDRQIGTEVIRRYLESLHEREKEKINAENALAQLEAHNKLQQQRALTAGFGMIMLLLSGLAFTFFKNLKDRKATNEQLKRLNRQLQNERESLAKSNQMLHGFALSISHDILNNIDLILSNGNILVGTTRNSKALGMYFDRTQHIGQQLKEYCLGLLQLARSYQKESIVDLPLHDPNPTVQQIIERFRPLLEEKNFLVQYTPLTLAPIPLAVVSQVFQNLISNAIRHAGDAASSPPQLSIWAENKHTWIVEDNGPGIPAHLINDLFIQTADSSKGQGIGLVQVREILIKYNAQIRAENNPLGGARFIISF